jgi:hypothetical protein
LYGRPDVLYHFEAQSCSRWRGMKGYVIFDARTGTHVVSHVFENALGLLGLANEADTTVQAQSIAAMAFGLLTNASMAVMGDKEVATVETADDVRSLLLQRGIESEIDDHSANVAPLQSLQLGDTALTFYLHAVFPLGIVLATSSCDAFARDLSERLAKRFCHLHGVAYMEGASRGVAKAFRKLFTPEVARALLAAASAPLRQAAQLSPATAHLAPHEHHVAIVDCGARQGRWMLLGRVDQVTGSFDTSFAPVGDVPNGTKFADRVAALDEYRDSITTSSGVDSEPLADVADFLLEVNAGPQSSFAAYYSGAHDVYVLSSLRQHALQDSVLTDDDAPTPTLKDLVSVAHAMAKLGGKLPQALTHTEHLGAVEK